MAFFLYLCSILFEATKAKASYNRFVNNTEMKKLSIIVPVYQVEKYIRSCIESIFKQGLDDADFELIIVNDGTKDRSMEVIADIISQHDNVIVINQENLSLSVARNNGIAKAQGEYILMPDSDDLLIENSLPLLLEKALETKVDLVVADFLVMYDNEIEQFEGISQNKADFEKKTGKELLQDLNPHQCYVWRTLYKRAFIIQEHLEFVPNVCYQDVPFTHECYIKAGNCLRTNRLLNIYRKERKGSNTASFNLNKAFNYCVVIKKTWELTSIDGLDPMMLKKLQDDVYTTFYIMVHSTLHSNINSSDFRRIINTLNREVPSLRFTNGIKQKVETLLFKNTPLLYVTIRILLRKWHGIHNKVER